MSNPVYSLLRKTYGVLSRYPAVVRWREAYRKKEMK